MKKAIALAFCLALSATFVHADEQRADEKKSEKAKSKSKAKKKESSSGKKSDQNVAQKAESDVGHWARKNHVWGRPRPGD